jgi:outer membrane protein TolC
MIKRTVTIFFLSITFLIAAAQDTVSLFQAIEIGLENNYSIKLQRNYQQVADNNNSVGNAGFLPAVDLEASPNRSISTAHSKYISGTEKDVSNAVNNSFTAGLELTWTIFDGFSMFADKKMLEVLEQMGETQVRLTVENTLNTIILTYFGIVQEKKLVQVLYEAVGLSMERKKLAAAKISIGAGSKLMLLQSSVDLNADSARLLNELTTLANLKADLNHLLGRNPETGYEVLDLLEINGNLIFEDLLSKLQSQNAELLIARNNQEIAGLALYDTRSDRYPKLDLDAAYNFNLSNSQSGFLEYNRAYGPNLGLTLSYNLFNGFNTNRNIKNAKIEVSSSEIQLNDTQLGIRTQLYKTFQEYKLNLDIIQLETSNCEVARENVEVAIEKYKLGAISDFELREIQNKYIDAQYQLLLSQFRAKQAETELLRMSGELNKIFVYK